MPKIIDDSKLKPSAVDFVPPLTVEVSKCRDSVWEWESSSVPAPELHLEECLKNARPPPSGPFS